jgi:glycine/serine hydroxymethyltransferase
MEEPEMKKIAKFINEVVEEIRPWADLKFDNFMLKVRKSKVIKQVALDVEKLTKHFPLDI